MPINAVDTVWILISSAMVLLMTPGVSLFYAGMVRTKNVLSTIMMSFMALGLIGLLWVVFGYSLSFGNDIGGLIGGFNFLGLVNVGMEPSAVYATTIPQMGFMVFQGMFAIITVALVTGAVVERMRFSSLVLFSVAWFVLVYCPVAHWVWGSGGWLAKLGVLDFAGGIVVHITAGVSALSLAIVLGPRKDYLDGMSIEPHNIPMVVTGAGLLWFGWFGFNAGSALSAGPLAVNAFVATNIAGASAALTWMLLSWFYRRPNVLGMATGAVAGLAAVTPAAGFISPMMAIPIGVGVAVISYYTMLMRSRSGVDEPLDVWAVHGVGGTWGVLATGIFCSAAVNPSGADGLIHGSFKQVGLQLLAIAVVWVFSFGVTWILGKIIAGTIGIRVDFTEESVGLDISQHGERAYGGELK